MLGVNSPAAAPNTNPFTLVAFPKDRDNMRPWCICQATTTVSVSQRQGVHCCRTNSTKTSSKSGTSICLHVSACHSVRLQVGVQPASKQRLWENSWARLRKERRDKNYSVKQVYSWSPTAAFLYLDQWCFLVCNQDWGGGSAVWGGGGVANNNTHTHRTHTVYGRVVCTRPSLSAKSKKKKVLYIFISLGKKILWLMTQGNAQRENRRGVN